MRNDLQVKVTWTINDRDLDEIHFDFYNRRYEYIGDIIVSKNGNLEWHILNALYQDNFFVIIRKLNGINTIDYLDNVEKRRKPKRWNNVLQYIYDSGLYINYAGKKLIEQEKCKTYIKN